MFHTCAVVGDGGTVLLVAVICVACVAPGYERCDRKVLGWSVVFSDDGGVVPILNISSGIASQLTLTLNNIISEIKLLTKNK